MGIDVDADQFLKGAQGFIDYRVEPSLIQTKDFGLEKAPQRSASLDSFYQMIGQGRIFKSASNLSPLETYKVKGSFAPTQLKLYAKELIWGTFALLVISLVIFTIIKMVLKTVRKKETGTPQTSQKVYLSSALGMSLGLSFSSSLLMFLHLLYGIPWLVLPLRQH